MMALRILRYGLWGLVPAALIGSVGSVSGSGG